jgi:hypothetical protein
VIQLNQAGGAVQYAEHLGPFEVPAGEQGLVVRPESAVGLGVMAAGMEVVAMPPMRHLGPHYLGGVYPGSGASCTGPKMIAAGIRHRRFRAGRQPAITRARFALKTEFLRLLP